MNQNSDIAVNSIKVISSNDSNNKNSGCMILNGGMVCKKTINCKSLITDSLKINEETKIKNLYVEDLKVDNLNISNIHNFNCNFSTTSKSILYLYSYSD